MNWRTNDLAPVARHAEFITANEDVKLEIFEVESLGAIHGEARLILKEHAVETSP